MQRMGQSFCISKPAPSVSAGIKTTLYELIEAVSEEVNPDEEQWVPLIVDHMLGSGKSVHQV